MVCFDELHLEIPDLDKFLIVCSLDRGIDWIGLDDLTINTLTLGVYCDPTAAAMLEYLVEVDAKLDNADHDNDLLWLIDLDCFSAVSPIQGSSVGLCEIGVKDFVLLFDLVQIL